MQNWIKLLGTKDEPYDQRRHLANDHSRVLFPSRRAAVKKGDRLFLYTGTPYHRFFGVVTAADRPRRRPGDHRWPLEVRVLPNLVLTRIEAGVPADRVLPLPSGTRSLSLRQQSHVRITPEDAAALSRALLEALRAELTGLDLLLPQEYL
ncbi:MAG: hypothetical protein K6T75_07375 [Acetobacteraceae bacterium]|nr:hypothetical protein [Acetobacteraceae bacterium]